MRITRQCDETEAREIFAASRDKADVWVGYAEDGYLGMVSYDVFGYTVGRPLRKLFAVEEHCVDSKGGPGLCEPGLSARCREVSRPIRVQAWRTYRRVWGRRR